MRVYYVVMNMRGNISCEYLRRWGIVGYGVIRCLPPLLGRRWGGAPYSACQPRTGLADSAARALKRDRLHT